MDRSADFMIGPAQTYSVGGTLANGGGILVTGTQTHPYTWYYNPAVTKVGKFVKVGGFVIGTYDACKDTYSYAQYSSPASYTTGEKVIDRGLYTADIGLGVAAVSTGIYTFVTAAGAFTLAGFIPALLLAAGSTAAIYAILRGVIQLIRAGYNAGYFGWAWDKVKNGYNFVVTGVSNNYNQFIEWGGRKIAAFENGIIRMGMQGVDGGMPYEGYSGLRDEIPNSQTGIDVYKPNIYCYFDQDMAIQVKLGREYLITASEPAYAEGRGWTADMIGGSINGRGDYLFYEARVPDEDFAQERGWLVRAGNRARDIVRILDLYGFNEREKADFLDYWVPNLEGVGDLVFYPQETRIVDRIMPLEVTPQADHIYRIWFYMTIANNSLPPEPAAVERIAVRRNVVVEWGGVIQLD